MAQRNVENPEWKLEDCQKAELMNCYTIVDGARIANPKSKSKKLLPVLWINISRCISVLNVGNMTVVNMIGKILKPIVEKWAKAKVREKPVIYGIRRWVQTFFHRLSHFDWSMVEITYSYWFTSAGTREEHGCPVTLTFGRLIFCP